MSKPKPPPSPPWEEMLALQQQQMQMNNAISQEFLGIFREQTASQEARLDEFARLGFGEPVAVSAEHGRGESALRELIDARLGPAPEEEEAPPKRIKISFIGRPNVGKSSLGNRLLKTERLIVTDIPGTTRDAVELDLDYQSEKGGVWPFRLVDTAGIRQRTKVNTSVEFFSVKRSEQAIASSDVVFLVVDALGGITNQEQKLGGAVLETGRALVIVVNKWDLVHERFREGGVDGYETEREFREAFEEELRKQLFFTPDSPVVFVSAKEGYAIERILRAARKIDEVLDRKLPTGRLNQLLAKLAEKKAPPSTRGQRFRIYYAVQTRNRPFAVRLFCNRASKLPDTYKRYLQSGISNEFDLGGCPIRFELVGKPKKPWEK